MSGDNAAVPRSTAIARWCLTALSLLLAAGPVAASTSRTALVSFRRIAIPDDVPAHLCSAIAQDSRGLLWFGTQRGLVRYDGYEFRIFRADPGDPKTLAGNYVRALLAASDGRIWVGTFSGGLSVFDPATETVTRFGFDRVEGLAEDKSGRIWVATTAGLMRVDPRTRAIEKMWDRSVRGLLIDRAGRVWVGSREGLHQWTASWMQPVPALAGQHVMRLYEDRRGRIWIGTEEQGAAVLETARGALTRIAPRPADPEGLSHYWVYGFAEGAPGEIWVATFGGGIDVVDEESLRVIDRLRHDPVLDDTIGADRVGAVFRDRAGAIWVGTWGEGLARHDPRTRAFRSLRASPNRPEGLTHAAAVRALELRDGTIWVGTNGNGIDILDRDLRRIGAHRPDQRIAGSLSDGAITCLAQAADGTVWVATLNSSLHRLRPGASRFDRLPAEQLAGGQIRTIAFGRDGVVWAGSSGGMTRIDPQTLATKSYRQWPRSAKASPAIEAIVAASDGTLWVGSDNGLYSFDPRTETPVHIPKDTARPDGLPDNWVPDLLLARDGRLWVGTASGAAVLRSWDGVSARFDVVAKRLGRPPAPAEALVEDGEGQVWIGPRLRVDATRWTAREFGPPEGVIFRNFFIASRARTSDGRLLFGSPQGLLVVEPKALSTHRAELPIVATSLQIEGKVRAGAAAMRALTLTPSERSFGLDVAALDDSAPQRLVYRHRLEGLDRDWTVAGEGQRSFTYSRLPPGRYTLRVGVRQRDGVWSASELRVPVTVQPAVHQTWWFRTLLAAAAAALIYGAYRLRVRQLRERGRALETLVAVRTTELAERNRELESAYVQIEQASLTDPLTGLRNRRYLEQTIGADLEIAARGDGRDLVLLLVDLDHFKHVNDQYGHLAGDLVLVQLSELLVRTFRASDSIVRWGGEEFLIVVRFVDRIHGSELAEKLRSAVASHPFVLTDGTTLQRTCSIGFASFPFSPAEPHALSADQVIDLADAALYAAKRSGRNAWVGIALGPAAPGAADAVAVFVSDPERALREGLITIGAAERLEGSLALR